jgi:hypothetical protein
VVTPLLPRLSPSCAQPVSFFRPPASSSALQLPAVRALARVRQVLFWQTSLTRRWPSSMSCSF